jgi:hypothetical protein
MSHPWRLLVLPALTACSFTVRGVETDFPDLSVADEPDLAMTFDLATTPDLASPDLSLPDLVPPPAPCPMVSSLVGCWRFEGSAGDDSQYGNDGITANATFASGVSGQSIAIGPTTLVTIADATSLDVTNQFTFETWVLVTALPGTRSGLLDNDGQYGLFIHALGEVRCTPGPGLTSAAGTITTGSWTHVACSYDGATLRIYKNGNEISSVAMTGALGVGNTNGLRLGSNSPSGDNLAGQLDELRIWNVARTQPEICLAAGGSGC